MPKSRHGFTKGEFARLRAIALEIGMTDLSMRTSFWFVLWNHRRRTTLETTNSPEPLDTLVPSFPVLEGFRVEVPLSSAKRGVSITGSLWQRELSLV